MSFRDNLDESLAKVLRRRFAPVAVAASALLASGTTVTDPSIGRLLDSARTADVRAAYGQERKGPRQLVLEPPTTSESVVIAAHGSHRSHTSHGSHTSHYSGANVRGPSMRGSHFSHTSHASHTSHYSGGYSIPQTIYPGPVISPMPQPSIPSAPPPSVVYVPPAPAKESAKPAPPKSVGSNTAPLTVSAPAERVGFESIEKYAIQSEVVVIWLVVQGDQLVTKETQIVRVAGVKTPFRSAMPSVTSSPGGIESYEFTKEAVQGKTVTLEFDPDLPNQNGAVVAHVTLDDGRDLGCLLLENGLAKVETKHPFKRLEEFKAIEAKARSAKKGLWGIK